MDTFIHIAAITAPLLLSPGANNILLMNTGLHHGLLRCIPHILGSVSGFLIILALCYVGLSQWIDSQPEALMVIRWLGALWLFYLAYGLIYSQKSTSSAERSNEEGDTLNQPFGFFQAVVFMMFNPGALSLSLIVFAVAANVSLFVALFVVGVMGLIATMIWALNGRLLSKVIAQPKFKKWLMNLMGLALVFSAFRIVGS